MRTILVVGLCLVAVPALAQPQTDQPAEGTGGAAVVEETSQEEMEAAPPDEPHTPPPPPEESTPPADAPPEPAPSKLEDFRHRHQVSARATFGKGYRLAFAYGEHEVCGRNDDGADETPCYSGSPAFADLDLSFGLTDGLELSLMMRLGLEAEVTGALNSAGDFDETRPLVLGFGIRAYADPPARVKVFLGARIMYDFTKAGVDEKNDFAIRAEPGLQIEIIRYVAFYIQAGATLGFLRWLRFEIDGGAGLQLRVP